MNYENPKTIETTKKSYLRIIASSLLIGCSIGIMITLMKYTGGEENTITNYPTATTRTTTGGSNYKYLGPTRELKNEKKRGAGGVAEITNVGQPASYGNIGDKETDKGGTQPVLKKQEPILTPSKQTKAVYSHITNDKTLLLQRTEGLISNIEYGYHLYRQCSLSAIDVSHCYKYGIAVSVAESGGFRKMYNGSNNGYGIMYRGKLQRFDSVEDSIDRWIKSYNKYWYKNITPNDWLRRSKYCVSDCEHWIGNVQNALNKLNGL